jgi:Trypsin-like peptidase domain
VVREKLNNHAPVFIYSTTIVYSLNMVSPRNILVLSISIGLLAPLSGLAQTRPTANTSTTASTTSSTTGAWSDGPRRATLALGLITKDETGVNRFTAGAAAVLLKDSSNRVFIATALHVFESPLEHWAPDSLQVRGWRDETKTRYQDFGSVLQLRKNGRPLYTASPQFDLAVIPAPQEILQRIADDNHIATVYGPDWIGGASEIYDGADVFILGFPSLVGSQFQQHALMRAGTIAWADSSHLADHEFYVDARIVPGNSGGPVFASAAGITRSAGIESGRATKLLGIVSQPLNTQPELALGAHLPATGPTPANVGLIEPAHVLIELMAQAAR